MIGRSPDIEEVNPEKAVNKKGRRRIYREEQANSWRFGNFYWSIFHMSRNTAHRHEMLTFFGGGSGGIESNKVNPQSCISVRFWQRISNPNEAPTA